MSVPIPHPPTIPFLGNVTSIDNELPILSFRLLAEQYGEIYQLNMLGPWFIVLNSYALQNEVSDDKKYKKVIAGALNQVRHAAGDGLFTAHLDEPNWGKAHRMLMPAFGPIPIREMFDGMLDICQQMLLKWERFGSKPFNPADDYTKLTFETIAFCSMSYRINAFYTENMPPFIQAMGDFLKESGTRSRRPALVKALYSTSNAKWEQDAKTMQDLCYEIIAERKVNPTQKKDLLDLMLHGRDPKTGEGLPDSNIVYNLITFLIAGHETTSGTLSFATYELCKSPSAMAALRKEVDDVVGDRPIKVNDVTKMPYLSAVLRETLRLYPPVGVRSVVAQEDTVLLGKYAVKKDQPILICTTTCQRDPKVWGDDANVFKPERMLDGAFEKLPPNAWQPFGFGMRGCIGRPFAWQESQLVLATIIQKFVVQLADPSYSLVYKQTLTVKPKDMEIKVTLRPGRHVASALPPAPAPAASSAQKAVYEQGKTPLYVLYGSNTGTSEAFAQRIANGASSHGFIAKIGTLDSAVIDMPKGGPVVIITSSYEGQPPDNATHFIDWLTGLRSDELKGIEYAVFGCGNHEWAQTYQRIPKLCDDEISKRGGNRLVERMMGDAATAGFFESFETWEGKLWEALVKHYDTSVSEAKGLQVEMVTSSTSRAEVLRQNDADFGTVVENRLLTAPGKPAKRHIEFELPEGMTTHAGDYLAIIPTNPERDVRRVLARLHLTGDQEILISSDSPTPLPSGKAITIHALLSGYVELAQPATSKDLGSLAKGAKLDSTKRALENLIQNHAQEIVAKRQSVLDVLEMYPDIDIKLGAFLDVLPPMRIRQYSISSSPLWNPTHVTLTVSVIDAPALSGHKESFLGVASTFLAGLRAGDRVQMCVRSSPQAFHLPPEPEVPVLMFCAGSGLAPMRGFIQERAMQKKAGRQVGRMLLFFGCRSPQEDFIYSESDLKEWIGDGVVEVRPAFSRSTPDSEGCKYVQDRVLHDKADIVELYTSGAKLYACGSGKMSTGVKGALIDIIREVQGIDTVAAEKTWDKCVKERFATDIFE